MTTLIIISAYILSVFLARWINKLLYKKDKCNPIAPWMWFVPIVGLIALIIIYFRESFSERSNWFTGKEW